jgi:C-terminal processing protease CtpA/Prc
MSGLRLLVGVLLALVSVCPLFSQQQNVNSERGRAKSVLKVIAKNLEKNFYDPQMKGLDWKTLVAEAEDKIEKAQTVNQLYLAIFVLVDKLDDSHTIFSPPRRLARPIFGFKAKAYGSDIYVYDIKAKGAAQAAGLELGDRILKVNGFAVTRNNFGKMMLFYHFLQPVAKLDLMIQRSGEEPKPLVVTAKIQSETAHKDLTEWTNFWELLMDLESDENENRSSYALPGADGIGLLRLRSFNAEPDTISGWFTMVNKGKAMILDLRGNPGGRLESVVHLAGQIATEPDVIAEEVTRKKTEPLKVKPRRNLPPAGIVVLVDSESASASEMFARYVQMKKKGIVIGDRTAGAVTSSLYYAEAIGADSVVPFGVQVGVGRIVFPGDEVLEKKGITPDQLCVPTQEQLKLNQDPCMAAARAYLLAAIAGDAKPAASAKSN